MFNLLKKAAFQSCWQYCRRSHETRKAKAKQKLIKIESETALMEKRIAGEIEWDVEAVKGSMIPGKMNI
ncbi:MAG: hypothetical protein CM15mV144_130 [Caudoviricetes sp.]|nr:MAG: hypothetical protein CM15mV144_130 [Caudoviricetes sp.]